MNTLSPVQADAFALLSDDLYLHLDEVELLANQDSEWSAEDRETAREIICDLVRVIRELLREHKLQADGDCRICTSAWPCPVATTIHALVKDPKRQFVPLVLRAKNLD
ncbi:MAG: hypothetical protein ACRDTF_09825 [Pseudonocardiaceae bacterium]